MGSPLLLRIASFETKQVRFTCDGRPIAARQGESLLAALLSAGDHLRRHEGNGEPRAGFCLMGACQDCWVWIGPDRRARACTTPVADGLQVSTIPPAPAGFA
ncbi:(2Fe-2S)-binding protein [Bosea sp. BK604]|uniref:(2Fe-2S)-binding protein n=1 Tax=Bosea sp. BK604 TaxID=2512180 RepID=UPI001049BD16|nr:(2Fe-2S)-binding protein [Bosea sp. BK604]TCR63154.1 2Fe-2S iron-sulfur cluster protein [Bosea sp. BK604]